MGYFYFSACSLSYSPHCFRSTGSYSNDLACVKSTVVIHNRMGSRHMLDPTLYTEF